MTASPITPGPNTHPFDDMVYVASLDGVSQADVVKKVTPVAIAENAGRIYDWMTEVGFGEDSWTRETMFAYAAHAFGVDYDVFYDAWMAEKPVVIPA